MVKLLNTFTRKLEALKRADLRDAVRLTELPPLTLLEIIAHFFLELPMCFLEINVKHYYEWNENKANQVIIGGKNKANTHRLHSS